MIKVTPNKRLDLPEWRRAKTFEALLNSRYAMALAIRQARLDACVWRKPALWPINWRWDFEGGLG